MRSESGLTLVELLAAMAIFLVVVSATLLAWEGFERGNLRVHDQEAAADGARTTVDRLARDLRNHATPTPLMPEAIEKAEAQDVVLVTVGTARPAGSANARNLRRVRYCVAPASRALWTQEQRWTSATPPAAPSTAGCPATDGWTDTEQVAEHVTNGSRAAFSFAPAGWTDPNQIRTVGASVWVDVDAARRPRETRLQTTVQLRNQNLPPISGFTAQPVGNGHVVLSAATARDPEGHRLEYVWRDGGQDLTDGADPECPNAPVCDLQTTLGTHSFSLTVRDPSELETTSPAQVVTVG